MAIQMRRGANTDFNASKMLPGEVAVTTDGTKKAYVAFAPNVVKELASKEDVQDLINSFTSVVDKEIAEAEQRIESKGQEVLDTIPDLYEEVSARADEAIRTKADAIICTVSGVAPIAQDSSNDYARNLKLYGKTTQPTTSGKQLCNFPDAENINYEGITWSCKNGVVTAKGTSTALSYTSNTAIVSYLTGQKGTYFISGNVENVKAIVGVRDASGTATYYTNQSFTLDGTEQLAYIYCQIASGVTVDATLYPMLNEGTTALHWEKYTGLQQSPSPNYPQDLESVGKWGNLLEVTLASQTADGNTYTVNNNKSITVNGEASKFVEIVLGKAHLKKGKYVLTGCPPTGSASTYIFRLGYGESQTYVGLEDGSGLEFEVTEEETYYIRVHIASGYTSNNLVLKPMITRKSDNITSYRPYSGQREIESAVYEKNWLENTAVSRTENGVSFVVNADKSVTVNGTATNNTFFNITDAFDFVANTEYILSGCPNGGTDRTYFMYVTDLTNQGDQYDKGNGARIFTEEDKTKSVGICVFSGATVNNLTFYPMIRKAEITDGTYVPYSKQSHISLVADGLKGIPVTDASLATYTDENGQMWCSDYVDCEVQKRVGNTETRVYDGSEDENWVVIEANGVMYANTLIETGNTSQYSRELLCTHYPKSTASRYSLMEDKTCGVGFNTFSSATRFLIRDDERTTSLEDWKAWLAENPITLVYRRITPIETPLSASEIESFKALRSNYHVTTVMNDCDAYMDFTYNADTEIWINNKIEAKVASALASLALS